MAGLLRNVVSALTRLPKIEVTRSDHLPRLGSDGLPSWCCTAGFIDVETTGLDSEKDEVIELAFLLFAFEPIKGQIMGVVDEYVGLREPACCINPRASKVNGITLDMVRGKRLDHDRIDALFGRSDFLVSHNADFDQAFVQRLFPSCCSKPWLCSMNGVDWECYDFRSKGLGSLLKDHAIRTDEVHRAGADAEAALVLLARKSSEGSTYFHELLKDSASEWIGPMLMRGTAPEWASVLDRHFAFQWMIENHYPYRESSPPALETAIRACELQIAMAQEAAKAFKRNEPRSPLPGHKGFTQLAIVREKRGDYAEAIRLSQLAAKQRWDGDWDKRIARCEKRLAKVGK